MRAAKKEMGPTEIRKAADLAIKELGDYFERNPRKSTDGSVRAARQISREIDEYKARVARKAEARKAKAGAGGR